MVEELNQDNFDEKTKQGRVIVDFFADWCGPCQMMKPVFDKISAEFNDISFFKVNVDNNGQLANVYAVRSIPTTVFLQDGKEVDRIIGVMHGDALKDKIKEVFK